MKWFFSLLIIHFGSLCVHAQISTYTKSAAINNLNAKAREIIGNIRVRSDKLKHTIDDASFIATENGIKITVVLISSDKSKSTHTSQFNPADITTIDAL